MWPGSIIDNQMDSLAGALSFLTKVGLVPIVVHGGSVQLDRALAQAGVDVPTVKGLRKMTPPSALEIARRVLHDTNLKLVEGPREARHARVQFTSGVIDAKKLETPDLGLIGGSSPSVRPPSLNSAPRHAPHRRAARRDLAY